MYLQPGLPFLPDLLFFHVGPHSTCRVSMLGLPHCLFPGISLGLAPSVPPPITDLRVCDMFAGIRLPRISFSFGSLLFKTLLFFSLIPNGVIFHQFKPALSPTSPPQKRFFHHFPRLDPSPQIYPCFFQGSKLLNPR